MGSSPASYRWRRRSSTRCRLACGFSGWPVGVDTAVRTSINQAQGFTLGTPFCISAFLQDSIVAHTCSCHSEGQPSVHGHMAHVQQRQDPDRAVPTLDLSHATGTDASALRSSGLFLPAGSGVGCGHQLPWLRASTPSGHRGVLLSGRWHVPHACFPPHCSHCLMGPETRYLDTLTPSRGIC